VLVGITVCLVGLGTPGRVWLWKAINSEGWLSGSLGDCRRREGGRPIAAILISLAVSVVVGALAGVGREEPCPSSVGKLLSSIEIFKEGVGTSFSDLIEWSRLVSNV
jgi:hypothetical protein